MNSQDEVSAHEQRSTHVGARRGLLYLPSFTQIWAFGSRTERYPVSWQWYSLWGLPAPSSSKQGASTPSTSVMGTAIPWFDTVAGRKVGWWLHLDGLFSQVSSFVVAVAINTFFYPELTRKASGELVGHSYTITSFLQGIFCCCARTVPIYTRRKNQTPFTPGWFFQRDMELGNEDAYQATIFQQACERW